MSRHHSSLPDSLLDERPTAIQINLKLLGVCFYAALAYFTWPTSAKWWGFGVISIMSGMVSFGLLVQACKLIFQLWKIERLIAKFKRKGGEQKSSRLASDDALKKAGSLDV